VVSAAAGAASVEAGQEPSQLLALLRQKARGRHHVTGWSPVIMTVKAPRKVEREHHGIALGPVKHARGVAFSTLVFCEVFRAFTARSRLPTRAWPSRSPSFR
jgi:hypothetical protein